MFNTLEANRLAKLYYEGVFSFEHEGNMWTIEGIKKIKERKKWRKVLVVSKGEERVFLDLQ